VLAPRASEMDEASREVAAAKIPAKLVLDIPRKRPVVRLARVPKELRAVLLHEPVEHRRVRLPRQVRWREAAHLPAFALPMPSTPPRILSPFPLVPMARASSGRPAGQLGADSRHELSVEALVRARTPASDELRARAAGGLDRRLLEDTPADLPRRLGRLDPRAVRPGAPERRRRGARDHARVLRSRRSRSALGRPRRLAAHRALRGRAEEAGVWRWSREDGKPMPLGLIRLAGSNTRRPRESARTSPPTARSPYT